MALDASGAGALMGLAGPASGETLADWVRSVNDPSIYGGVAASQYQIDLSHIHAAGASASTTTNVATFAALDSCTLSVKVNGKQSVFLIAVIDSEIDTANKYNLFAFFRDSTQLGTGVANQFRDYPQAAADECLSSFSWLDAMPAAGTYTYTVQWATETAGNVATARERLIYAIVFPERNVV